MSKPKASAKVSMVHTPCISAVAEPQGPISTRRSLPILTSRATFLSPVEDMSLELHRALSRAWSGLFIGTCQTYEL